MLIKIASTADSAAGKQYANDILGRVFFPKAGVEMKAGDYAYAVKVMQTKTRNEQGDLVDLANPVEILQITATFATKAEAIAAAAEVGTLSMEVAAEVAKTAVDLKLSDEAVAKLAANAW